MQLFRNNCMQTLAHPTFARCLTGNWLDAAPHLCGLVENLTIAAVSPSLRPRHLIKRSKFSDEDATRMWILFLTSHTVPAPPAAPTPAPPPLSSPLSLRTFPRVQLAPSAHPSLRSNGLPEATAPSTPPWEIEGGVQNGKTQHWVQSADLDLHRLLTYLYLLFPKSLYLLTLIRHFIIIISKEKVSLWIKENTLTACNIFYIFYLFLSSKKPHQTVKALFLNSKHCFIVVL